MGRWGTGYAALPIIVLLAAAPPELSAQDLAVLGPEAVRLILQEVSGDAAYEHIRYQTQFHRPRGGSNGLWKVAEYFEAKAREYGLENVSLIKQASSGRPWNASFGDLWIVEPEPERLASTLQSPLHLGDYSRPTDVTGELIDIGAGSEEDLADLDVSGKVVLTYGSASGAMMRAVRDGGALGVVWYPNPFSEGMAGYPDQLRWVRASGGRSDDFEPTFVFGLSLRQGLELRSRLQNSDEPIVVHAVVESEFSSMQGSEPWQVMVEAFIPGSEPGLGQDIVLTGHMQEEATSANDDASGCANVLEIGRALNKLIGEGKLPRPRRNIRLWWVTEIGSQRQYFADNPEAHHEMWVNINQDMSGANQAQDVMRVQNVTRLPATRFHFFNDVVESVIDYMVASNSSQLAQLQAGTGFYPEPHLSHLGSRHRYNAKMIFFHNNTDHMPFTEQPIGVPGVTFTNWPDNYIHSSDDDLWNIDRTQLGRSAAAVALMAYTMANVDQESLPALAAETVGRGQERLGRNLRLALTWIATGGDKEAAYRDAVDQVRYAVGRERLAINSLGEIHSSAAAGVPALLEELARRQAQALREVELAYRQATGRRVIPQRRLSDVEQRLSELKPAVIAGPAEFLIGRRRVRFVRGLHGLMAFEVMNAVNGERSGLDIYRFVAAEAREAGAHYYGTVTAEAVLQYLENAAAA
ncbi:MAG: M28 family peptidase, partial [Gemmatimonadales bacterium]